MRPELTGAPVEGGPDVTDGGDLGFVSELSDTELVLDRVEWFDQEQLQDGYAVEGRDPAEATAYTASSRAFSARSISPGGISTSPMSTTVTSWSASTRSARWGRDPSWGR